MPGAVPQPEPVPVYGETSFFLVLGGVIIVLAHGVELATGGANWPALGVRLAWAGLLWVQAAILRGARPARVAAGIGASILGSVAFDLLLLLVTGRSGSPLLPFLFVLAILLPLMAFQLLWVGLLGAGLLLGGGLAMLVADEVPRLAVIAYLNAGGGAFAAGWILARALLRSRGQEELRRQALAESLGANQALVGELREALASVKTLTGLLPVCAWCRRVRNDAGYWQQLEGYISAHTEARFTHGLCQDCKQEHFPPDFEHAPPSGGKG